MSLTKKKTRIKDKTPIEVIKARKYLDELIKLFPPGTSPDFPRMDVAGMTPGTKLAQDQLTGAIATGGANYQLATDYNRGVLAGDFDPKTSDFYKGLRDEMTMLRDQSAAEIRRRGQREGGTTQTSPTMMGQDESNQRWNSKILQLLGSLFQDERTRQDQASGRLVEGDRGEVARLGTASSAAAAGQAEEQQRNIAIYNQALQELLFPYNQQLELISTMFGSPAPQYLMTGGGPKGWVSDLQFGADVYSGMQGKK